MSELPQANELLIRVGCFLGIQQFRTPRELRLDRMLLQPLFGPASQNPVGRDQDLS